MANQKKDDSDLEKPKKIKSPETDIFEIPKKKTKVPGKIKIIKTKEKETKKGTTKETADIKREILEEEVLQDNESPSLIEKLDYSNNCIEQLKSCERFKLVLTTTLFPKLFNNGVSKEELGKLTNFSSPTLSEKIKKITEKLRGTEHEINGPERIALRKLQEIASHSDSKLFSDLNKEWSNLIAENYAIYNQSIEAEKTITKPKAKKEEKEDENPITKFRKNNPTLSTVLLVAGAIAAGYGIYKYFIKKDGNKSKAIAGTAILGTIVLGGILGYPKVSKWFKEALGYFDFLKKVKNLPEEIVKKLDEKIGFTAMREKLSKLIDAKWLKELDLAEVAQDMGIDFEDESTWKKYTGPGGAALLIRDWAKKKNKLDPTSEKILDKAASREKATLEKTSEQIEAEKKYGEMVPLKDAMREYKEELDIALIPITQWMKINKDLVAGGGLYLAHIEVVRNALLTGAAGGLSGLISLTKVPFMAIHGFPLTSLFAVSAILLGGKTIKDNAENILVPKNSEGLKKYIKQKIKDGGEHIKELPPIPDKHVDIAVEIFVENPKKLWDYIAPPKEMIKGFAAKGMEYLALAPSELIKNVNSDGIGYFAGDLTVLQHKSKDEINEKQYSLYTALIADLKKLQKKVKQSGILKTTDLVDDLKKYTEPLGINIFIDDGYIKWIKFDDSLKSPICDGPRKIAVDPGLEQNEAVSKAQRFIKEGQTFWEEMGKPVTVGKEHIRMFLNRAFFEDASNEKEAGLVMQRKMREGTNIVWGVGEAWAYEVKEGVVHKYWLGPKRLVIHLMNAVPGGDEFSSCEALVDYAEGAIPVMVFGLTANLRRMTKIGTARVLLRSALYPFATFQEIYKFGGYSISKYRETGSLKAILEDPKAKISSDFWSFIRRRQSGWIADKFAILKHQKRIKNERFVLSYLDEARMYLLESRYKPGKKILFRQAREALKYTGISKIGLLQSDENVDDFLDSIQQRINRREVIVKKIRDNRRIEKAIKELKKGNIEKAKSHLSKMKETTFSGSPTESELKALIENNERFIERERADMGVGKAAEPEKPKEKLTEAEKKKAAEEIKKSRKQIDALIKEQDEKIKAAIEKATKDGKSISDPEVKQKISDIRAEYDKKAIDLYKTKIEPNIRHMDDAALREHGIDPKIRHEMPKLEAKFRGKGHPRLKRVGRGIIGFLATLAIVYGIGKGIELFHTEDEGFDLEKLRKSETPEQRKAREKGKKKMEDNVEYHGESINDIQHYFKLMEADYNKVNELMGNPKKLNETSDEKVIKLVNETSDKHKKNIDDLKEFMGKNRDAILLYYERLPKAKEGKDKSLGQFFSIGYDEDDNKPYLKYADESDFRQIIYENIDLYRAHMDDLLKGETLDGWDTAVHVGSYAAPVYGTYLDGKDCYNAIERGEVTTALKSGGWAIVGAASDALLVIGVVTFGGTALIGGAIKAIRWGGAATKGAIKGARALSIMKKLAKLQKQMRALQQASKLTKVGKYSGIGASAGIGADIGRQIFTPPKSQTYYF